MIVDKINRYLSTEGKTIDEALRYEVEKLAGVSFRRQFMTEDGEIKPREIRISNCGKCRRQLAYYYWGCKPKGKEIDSRSKLTFFAGDLTELMLVSLARLAGCQITAYGLNQIKVRFYVDDNHYIEGHPDGILFNGTPRLIEVKSMSSFAFKRFTQDKYIDESYICQINAYMDALGLTETVFLGLNKDSGVLGELIIKKDENIAHSVRLNALSVWSSKPDKLPAPPDAYKPNDKGFYPWNCLYCAYWGHCRVNAEKVLVKNAYKLKEKKEEK